jgi:hypothetical protein
LPGLRVLSRNRPSTPLFRKALLPAPDHRPADANLRRDLLHRAAADRGENDLRPFDVLALSVAVRLDCLQPLSVQRADHHAYRLCHPARFARQHSLANR